jgi:1-acyl-sn-glycerol-3-phosphate acyltransferase
MGSSIPRAIARLCGYLLITVPLMPVQAFLLVLGLPAARRLPFHYHRAVCRVLGVDVEVHGEISTARPTLFVCNHISYLDIEVLGSTILGAFVAKSEVATWPLIGWLARLQRTIFVERRSSGITAERDDLARRLDEGENVILFAEGTSGDGNRVRPFKSSLFSVAERPVHDRPLTVQPVSVAYTRLDGMPIGRQWRPFFAWYGDMDLAPHLWALVGLGRLTAVLIFHPPVTIADAGSRKALAAACHGVIGRGLEVANSGRFVPPVPAPAAAPAE